MVSPNVGSGACPTLIPCCLPERSFLCDPLLGPPRRIDHAEPLWRSWTVPTAEHPANAGPKKWITSARPMQLEMPQASGNGASPQPPPPPLAGVNPRVTALYGRPEAEFIVYVDPDQPSPAPPTKAECRIEVRVHAFRRSLDPNVPSGWAVIDHFSWEDLLPPFPQQIATVNLEEGCVIETRMRSRKVKYAGPPGDPGDPGQPPWGPPTGYSPDGTWQNYGTKLLFSIGPTPPPPP